MLLTGAGGGEAGDSSSDSGEAGDSSGEGSIGDGGDDDGCQRSFPSLLHHACVHVICSFLTCVNRHLAGTG